MTVRVVFFPLDQQLEVHERNWTEGIVREMVWISGRMESYQEAEEAFARIGKMSISDSTLWRQVEKRGEELRAYEEERRAKAMALPRQDEKPQLSSPGADRMGVSMDGAMVNILEEGWKELKVGTVFEVEQRPALDEKTKEWFDVTHATNNSYVAHLGGAAKFGELMWAEAQARGWEAARYQQTIGDGAKWIWNLADEHFPLSQRTVDWYHANEHLHGVAQFLYPDNERSRHRWSNQAETLLFQGHALTIADAIDQKVSENDALPAEELTREAGYFRSNYKRMQYMEFREEGFPIGSGMVESAAKQFKARFTGPGMRWSRDGLGRLLPVRSAVLAHSFDSLWESVF